MILSISLAFTAIGSESAFAEEIKIENFICIIKFTKTYNIRNFTNPDRNKNMQ